MSKTNISMSKNSILKHQIENDQSITLEETCLYNESTKMAMDDMINGIGLSKVFYTVEELMADLNADD